MQKLNLGSDDFVSLAAEVLNRGGNLTFTASGSSMLPTLKDGDVLSAVPIEPGSIDPGDVILYCTDDNRAAVHRISKLTGVQVPAASVFVSSDARPWAMYEVPSNRILGRISSAYRRSRKISFRYSPGRRIGIALYYVKWLVASTAKKAVSRSNSVLTSFKPVRKIFRFVLKPFVKYRMIPRDETPSDPGDRCSWELFQSCIGRKVIGEVQLVRFDPGSVFSSHQWLFSMRVKSIFRGCGIGRKLTRALIGHASMREGLDLCLIVSPDNTRALNLYLSLGFEIMDSSRVNDEIREHIKPGNCIMILRFTDPV